MEGGGNQAVQKPEGKAAFLSENVSRITSFGAGEDNGLMQCAAGPAVLVLACTYFIFPRMVLTLIQQVHKNPWAPEHGI